MTNYLKIYNTIFKKLGYNRHTHREPRFLFAAKYFAKSNLKSLVDIGTGHGLLLQIAHEINFQTELTSIDLKNYHGLNYVTHITTDITNKEDRDKITGKFEILTCLDCLEHVEEKDIYNVLEMFSRLSDIFLFSIANHSDIIDGVELHLIQKDSLWWTNKLSEFFDITYFEFLMDNRLYLYKCKSKQH